MTVRTGKAEETRQENKINKEEMFTVEICGVQEKKTAKMTSININTK